jgi:hypothetical protein
MLWIAPQKPTKDERDSFEVAGDKFDTLICAAFRLVARLKLQTHGSGFNRHDWTLAKERKLAWNPWETRHRRLFGRMHRLVLVRRAQLRTDGQKAALRITTDHRSQQCLPALECLPLRYAKPTGPPNPTRASATTQLHKRRRAELDSRSRPVSAVRYPDDDDGSVCACALSVTPSRDRCWEMEVLFAGRCRFRPVLTVCWLMIVERCEKGILAGRDLAEGRVEGFDGTVRLAFEGGCAVALGSAAIGAPVAGATSNRGPAGLQSARNASPVSRARIVGSGKASTVMEPDCITGAFLAVSMASPSMRPPRHSGPGSAWLWSRCVGLIRSSAWT